MVYIFLFYLKAKFQCGFCPFNWKGGAMVSIGNLFHPQYQLFVSKGNCDLSHNSNFFSWNFKLLSCIFWPFLIIMLSHNSAFVSHNSEFISCNSEMFLLSCLYHNSELTSHYSEFYLVNSDFFLVIMFISYSSAFINHNSEFLSCNSDFFLVILFISHSSEFWFSIL